MNGDSAQSAFLLIRQNDPERSAGASTTGRNRADETWRSWGGETGGSQRELAHSSCALIGRVKKRVLWIDCRSGRQIQVAANGEFYRRYRKAWILKLERPHCRAILIRSENEIGARADGGIGDSNWCSGRRGCRYHLRERQGTRADLQNR